MSRKNPVENLSAEILEKYLSFPHMAREYQPSLDGDYTYCLIDFETTGFRPDRDEIIEVAMLKARGPEVLERKGTLIRPGISIPTYIRSYTGIDDSMVAGGPTMEHYFPEMESFLGDHPVVAYSRFEKRFLDTLFERFAHGDFNNDYIDVMDLAMIMLPSLRSHRQVDLAELWSIKVEAAHRAYDDVEVLFHVYQALLNGLYNAGLPVLVTLMKHAGEEKTGLAYLIEDVISGRGGSEDLEGLRIEEVLRADGWWDEIPPLRGQAGPTTVRPSEVEDFFLPRGKISRQYEYYETRPEQMEMSDAVRSAMERGEVLMVEAGTGTGKSLAYLVPGAIRAMRSGKPLVVSTKTINLQDQLFTKDLPLLSNAMEGDVRYSVLKGYSNYVCLRKLQSLVDSDKKLSDGQLPVLGMLINWLAENAEGDLSLLNLGHHRGLFHLIAADFRDCLKDRCRLGREGHCFYRRAYRRAERSHIVVVNHSLLLVGTGLEPTAVVVDEAHTLEDVATEQFSPRLERGAILGFLDFLDEPGEGGYLPHMLSALIAKLEPSLRSGASAEVDSAREAVRECRVQAERFFDALRELRPDGERFYRGEFRITDGLREQEEYIVLTQEAVSLREKLTTIEHHLKRVMSLALGSEEKDDSLEGTMALIEGNIIRMEEFVDTLDFVISGESPQFVYWAAVSDSPSSIEVIMASPLDVGPALREALYESVGSVILTSATLTVGDDFSFVASRVGVQLLEPDRLKTLKLDSSFDFKKQMRILVVGNLSPPNEASYRDELVETLIHSIKAVGGGTLALFTNKRLMEWVYREVYPELERGGLRLICQMPGYSRRHITEEFLADESASLFGTSSFWEGVDARGDTLKLVVVTRLPFESPGRPVFEARCEALKLQGLNDFLVYSVPLAALRLKQGVGRLIRTTQDRGQVLITDSRVASRRYGNVMLSSLPDAEVVVVRREEVGEVLASFRG